MIEPLARLQQFAVSRAQRAQIGMMPELVIGPGKLYDIAPILEERGVNNVMIVTTKGFVQRGLPTSFVNDLLVHGIASAVFSDVKPDPDTECVECAAAFYRARGCQAMVAIGGGSVMDCAKVAGALIARPGKDVRDLTGAMKVRKATPFLIAVPTTAGTGSEVTAAAVITDPERQRKYAISDFALIPDVAVLDATLLVSLPPALTAYTGMDALTHAVEAYVNRFGSREARDYAEQAVELVFGHLKASYDDGKNLIEREHMLAASYYAGIAFTNAMVGYVHALAHGIGGRYHVQHGLANAVLLPVVLERYGEAAEDRLARLGDLIGCEGSSDHELAQAFIGRIRELSASLGIPQTIRELRLEDIPELAAGAEEEGNPAYPVPVIWNKSAFEIALRAVCDEGRTLGQKVSSQVEIVEPGPLLDESGRLAARGYAKSLLLDYDRSRIAAPAIRIKEWDYYLVNDDEYALAVTVGDMGYATLVSVSLIDFVEGAFTTRSTLGVLPLGRLGLPASSSEGITRFEGKKATAHFAVGGGMRHLVVGWEDFKDGKPLFAEVVLDREPRDSMVIATPWAEDDYAFYYNQKIVGQRAFGLFQLGGLQHSFQEDDSFGLLDWGRGVWTRDNTWYWSAAQGSQNGHVFGFNLGYGFGDTTAASENMAFVDGVAHKLGRVDFGIPMRDDAAKSIGERFDLMSSWRMTDDEGRLDLVFTPEVDRCDYIDFKAIVSDQHQVFGRFDGFIVLDGGERFDVRALRGFAEAVHNKY